MYRKNAWHKYDAKQVKEVMKFSEGYKEFLSFGKTERLVVKESIELLKAAGFKNIEEVKSVKAGDKVYFINRNKNICAFVIGKEPLNAGLRILGAHIDSPRLDLKEHPVYEKGGFAYGDTHYYGGVKKYQYVTIPLALHGVVCKKDGSKVEVNIGEDPKDPIVGITDLLIHLSADQMAKPMAKAIEGESLDITLGNMPLNEKEKNPVKATVLKLLNISTAPLFCCILLELSFISLELFLANSSTDSSISFLPEIPSGYLLSYEQYFFPCPGASAIKTINFALLFQALFNAFSKAHATSSGRSPPRSAYTFLIIFLI